MHIFEDVKILRVLASSEIFLFSYSDQIYTQDIYQEYLGQARKTEFLAMFLEDVEIFIKSHQSVYHSQLIVFIWFSEGCQILYVK
jgi:transketolase C-terminal domain/subunit